MCADLACDGCCAGAQGDACALPAGLGTFDAVLAANLLCRVPDPQTCLQGIADALNPGGVLVLTSPFTWMEDYTAKSEWVGGRVGEDGKPLRCADALKAAMAELGFTVLEEGKVCGLVLMREVNSGLCLGRTAVDIGLAVGLGLHACSI
jgi:SAM-dependent methyltransferase